VDSEKKYIPTGPYVCVLKEETFGVEGSDADFFGTLEMGEISNNDSKVEKHTKTVPLIGLL
jgi:hypothetical protein